MKANQLLSALLLVSEKGANIARICRQDDCLLSMLVREKKDSEKNPRFINDFKTLADVLVQEVVKHDLGYQFPSLVGHIHGEENNQFESNGEVITVEVKSTKQETINLLNQIINDVKACKTLAETLSSPINSDINIRELPPLPDNIGIWIDPIDSTAEYIKGDTTVNEDIVMSGLPCVTVLLGVFDRDSGDPIVGVINQPFYIKESSGWRSRLIYGINHLDITLSHPEILPSVRKAIAISSSEEEEIKTQLEKGGYELLVIAGAGYKLLNVILGHVCAYVLSKPTSYLWDICACHAVLKSLNGEIIDFNKLTPIKYQGKEMLDSFSNSGGIIAYRDENVKNDIIEILELRKY